MKEKSPISGVIVSQEKENNASCMARKIISRGIVLTRTRKTKKCTEDSGVQIWIFMDETAEVALVTAEKAKNIGYLIRAVAFMHVHIDTHLNNIERLIVM